MPEANLWILFRLMPTNNRYTIRHKHQYKLTPLLTPVIISTAILTYQHILIQRSLVSKVESAAIFQITNKMLGKKQ